MNSDKNFTYILYLTQDINNIIFLGACSDPSKLYYNSLDIETILQNKKPFLLKWLNLCETKLDQQEKKDMEYAFMYNPQNEFSYQIKDMTLHINKIKKF
jgi:hypothetical protein